MTFLIFLLNVFVIHVLHRKLLPSPPQSLWLHLCVIYSLPLKKMVVVALLCSVLNSVLTILWLLTGKSSTKVRHYAKGVAPLFFFISGAFILAILLPVAAHLHKASNAPQSLSHWNAVLPLINNYLLALGIIILVVGLLSLIVMTTAFSIIEFFNRLKHFAPRL